MFVKVHIVVAQTTVTIMTGNSYFPLINVCSIDFDPSCSNMFI